MSKIFFLSSVSFSSKLLTIKVALRNLNLAIGVRYEGGLEIPRLYQQMSLDLLTAPNHGLKPFAGNNNFLTSFLRNWG